MLYSYSRPKWTFWIRVYVYAEKGHENESKVITFNGFVPVKSHNYKK